jgi:hypothetical protein
MMPPQVPGVLYCQKLVLRMIALSRPIPTKATVTKLLVGSATMIAAPLLLSYFSPLLREGWVRIGIVHNIEGRDYVLMGAFSADVYLSTAYFSLLAVDHKEILSAPGVVSLVEFHGADVLEICVSHAVHQRDRSRHVFWQHQHLLMADKNGRHSRRRIATPTGIAVHLR